MPDPELTALLARLVAIPSVNPMLASGAHEMGEARLAEAVGAMLAAKRFHLAWHELSPGRPNLVARHGPDQPRRSVLIEAHVDTQGVHGMTVPPFEPTVRDGRLYGRGACDTKGPMAAALHALTLDRLDRLADAGVELVFVAAVGEEKGNVGAEQLVDLEVGGDEIIVLEPTDLAVVHAHKGTLWYEVEVGGLAAHGSNPNLGHNAIEDMMKVIHLLRVHQDRDQRRGEHALLGRTTMNIGLIRGGSSINIVPERCVIEVDRRTLPGDDHAVILRTLREALAEQIAAGELRQVEVRLINESRPFETAADSGLVQRLRASCQSHGVAGLTQGVGWYSDAGPFSRTCRAVAVFGPGHIAQAHTADEYIDLEQLACGSVILGDFLDRTAREVAAGASS